MSPASTLVTPALDRGTEHYLKWVLRPDMIAIVALSLLREVAVLPADRLSVIPHLPASVLGLVSQRGQVFWVVDLGNCLGLGQLGAGQQYFLIWGPARRVAFALATPPAGIIALSAAVWQPPPLPYVRRCVWQAEELLLDLDLAAIPVPIQP
jgi:positive phototaxis protein PixI